MAENNPNPVLVAVGHDPMEAAVTYAAREAARAGCGLHLLHVVHRITQGPETVLVANEDFERAGQVTLNSAAELARDLVPRDMTVTSELVRGGVVTSIVDVGAAARLIVLERRPLSRIARVVTRSVSSGVAARSRVPVVSVPARWSPARSSGVVPTVTVGVDVPDRSEPILRAAARAAKDRGARLRVLHTWAFPGAYDDIIMSRVEDEEWSMRAKREIQEVLDRIDDLTEVTVSVEARHAFAGDALIEAGRGSDLLVVGRHDPLFPLGSHLGPVARAVLREATCPVLFADAHYTRHKAGSRGRVGAAQPS